MEGDVENVLDPSEREERSAFARPRLWPTSETDPAWTDPSAPPHRLFLAALSKAQGAYQPLEKTKRVFIRGKDGKPGYEFWYAPLADILTSVRAALAQNGLSLSQPVTTDEEGKLWLESRLAHEGGHVDVSRVRLLGGEDLKAFGGEITYLRRYLAGPQLGVSAEDDIDEDGEGTDAESISARGIAQRAGAEREGGGNSIAQPSANLDAIVSAGQAANLANKLKVKGISEESVCARFKVTKLAEMSLRDWKVIQAELAAL